MLFRVLQSREKRAVVYLSTRGGSKLGTEEGKVGPSLVAAALVPRGSVLSQA